jgi:hypothetical protein
LDAQKICKLKVFYAHLYLNFAYIFLCTYVSGHTPYCSGPETSVSDANECTSKIDLDLCRVDKEPFVTEIVHKSKCNGAHIAVD